MLGCKVLQVGFGSLGKEIFIELLKRKNLKAVGVIDIAKSNLGNDPGILTLNRKAGIKIVGNIEDVKSKPDVALHATTSSLGEAYYQISELLNHRINVLSTCEQLVYPYGNNKKIAKKLHMIAKKNKVSVLGVGVNLGFVMDSLVLKLTSLCSNIHRIRIERVVNIANRRKALQEKMCLGLGLDQYKKFKKNVGHVGLHESARMICDTLKIYDTLKQKAITISTTVRPIIATHKLQVRDVTVEMGQITGLEHKLVAKKHNSNFLEMTLSMFVGAVDFDYVEIEGTPPISVRTNGINGDQATVALLFNYIPIILEEEPGLHTVNCLRIPNFS